MDKNVNKIYKYSIRKFKAGVGSAIVGLGLVFAGTEAYASEEKVSINTEVPAQVETSAQLITSEVVTESVVDKKAIHETSLVVETKEVPATGLNQVSEVTKTEVVDKKVEVNSSPVTSKEEVASLGKEEKVTVTTEKPVSRTAFRNTGANTQLLDDVYKGVEADLKAVDLNASPEIAAKLSPGRISAIDVINKRLEISKATNRPILQVTDAEATAAIKAESIGKLSLDSGFTAAQNDLENLVKNAVRDAVAKNPNLTAQDYIARIEANKEAFLLGAAYINKYYDLQFGAMNTKDMLKTNPSFYGGKDKQSALDFLIAVGNQTYQEMSITNTVNTYNKLFRDKISDKLTIPEFLEYNNKISNTGKSIQDWFVGESKTYISEVKSQEPTKQNSTYRIYDVLKNNTHLNYNLLPLLAVSENSIYALSNTAGITFGIVDAYVNKKADAATQTTQLNEFKDRLDKANAIQQNFIDFWYRVAKPETHAKLEEPTMTTDTLLRRTDKDTDLMRDRWSAQTGTNAAIGVKEFIAPMGLYATFVQAGGEAANNSLRLFMTKALEINGLTTYAHEMTHIYEDKVWMAQDVRDGLLAEFYARGLYEPYQYSTEPYFNINTMFEVTDKEKVYNGSPSRFKSAYDLKEYMSGTFDVLYTLDLLEAEEVLNKSAEDKKWWFSKIQLASTNKQYPGIGAYVHKANEVVALDDATANKLKTVNDLVDNDIIAERTPIKSYKNRGHFENNDYYSVPLYSSNYAALENDKGVSGDYQTRRMAYELLAQYGYYDGMVPYISNQYKKDAEAAGKVLSDEFIFDKIFKGQYENAKAFKKDMFEIRKNKLDKLKPVTISYNNQTHTVDSLDKLKSLFKEAVAADLRDKPDITQQFAYNARNVEKLKAAIYKAYLNDTNEFRDSIYREPLADTNEPLVSPVKATWTNGYVAPVEDVVKNAVRIDAALVKSKDIITAESNQGEITVLVTYTDGSTDKVKVPVSIDPVTKKEVLAKSTRYERNDNLDFGQKETITGKDGSFENLFTYTLENGVFVEKISKQNEVLAVDDLIKVGTKENTKVEENPYAVIRIDAKDLKLGSETLKTKGQNEIVHYVTTYALDLTTGIVTPTTVRLVIQAKVDEEVLVGLLETAKGSGLIADELGQLEIAGKPVFEKGSPLRVEEKPSLDLPKVEVAKGEPLTREELKAIEIEISKGASLVQEEKVVLELPKVVVTAKGQSLTREELKTIELSIEKAIEILQTEKISENIDKSPVTVVEKKSSVGVQTSKVNSENKATKVLPKTSAVKSEDSSSLNLLPMVLLALLARKKRKLIKKKFAVI